MYQTEIGKTMFQYKTGLLPDIRIFNNFYMKESGSLLCNSLSPDILSSVSYQPLKKN